MTLLPYGLISRTGTPPKSGTYLLHVGGVGVLEGSLQEIDYDDMADHPITGTSKGGWLGLTDKYWLAALIPAKDEAVQTRFTHFMRDKLDVYQVDYLAPARTIAPGGTSELTERFFAGAKEVHLLDMYEKKLGIDKFSYAVDWGWFNFLTRPIFYVLDYFKGILGNFALAILALTVLIKLAFFPLANKSYRAMSRMKTLQPKMMELRERYKDDKARLNQEMMALYKKENANPMAGCLPLVIQIPVFFALYKVLYVTIEMRHAPFFGWVHDLSAPDPTSILNLFGLFHWTPPHELAFLAIGAWPVIMGITMFLQQRLNPAPPDPVQQKMFMLLPIVFTFMLAHFPVGLVIYWSWNNTLSIAQQWVIMRRAGVKRTPAAGQEGGQEDVTAGPTAPDDGARERGRLLFARECEFVAGAASLAGLPAGALPEIAFAGRSNVGKSSLINALTGRNTLARTSNTPGRTRQVNFFRLGEAIMLVDLPGYGYAKAPKSEVAAWTRLIGAYLRGRPELRRLMLLIDARHGLKPSDRDLMAMLDEAAVSYQGVLTKTDKCRADALDAMVAATAAELARHVAAHPVLHATSAHTGAGIEALRAEIAALAEA